MRSFFKGFKTDKNEPKFYCTKCLRAMTISTVKKEDKEFKTLHCCHCANGECGCRRSFPDLLMPGIRSIFLSRYDITPTYSYEERIDALVDRMNMTQAAVAKLMPVEKIIRKTHKKRTGGRK